jgi:hypothetical protein
MDALVSPRSAESNTIAIYDVGSCIKLWGRRGILLGGLFGFALGAIFVAIPLTTDVLTFGTFGTLIVGAVECAVIAGAFGAFAAVVYGKGALRGNATRFERSLTANRQPEHSNWREENIPLSEWPTRWAYPGLTAARPVPPTADDDAIPVGRSWQSIQAQLCTIEAWENDSIGR